MICASATGFGADDLHDIVVGHENALRAKVLCDPDLLRPGINRQDLCGAADSRTLNDVQSHAAAAEDDNAFAGLNFGGKHRRSHAGGDGASD